MGGAVVGSHEVAVQPKAAALARRRGLILAALLILVLTPVAAGNGGYFPVAWGWAGIAFAGAALVGLVLQSRLELSLAERVMLAAWAGVAGWIGLSIAWSADPTQSVLEVERVTVYVAAFWALLVIGDRRSARDVLVAVLVCVCMVCLYSLGTHLLPDRLGVHLDFVQSGRLNYPLGYWNALGIFAAMGYLVGLGFAARPRDRWLRVVAALPLPILASTMYFTFSRGAWVAAAAGVAAVVAVAPGRLRYLLTLLALAPSSAVPVVWGASSAPLTAAVPSVHRVEGPGHELALIVAACVLASALTAGILARLQERFSPGTTVRTAFAIGLVAAAVLSASTIVDHYGGPSHIVSRTRASLAESSPGTGGPLSRRLFSLSLNGRPDLWRAALKEQRAHPLLGDGAGAYERFWLQHRLVGLDVRDAHSLYLETLSELGPVGLVLLLTGLGVPLYAAVRARRRTLVPVALGAYVALLVHASFDWDWEVPAVMLTGIACAATLLLMARTRDRRTSTGRPAAWILPAVPAVLLAVAVLGLLSNRALSAASSDIATHNSTGAAHQASVAHRWAPWSYQPYDTAGRAAAAAGDRAAAARAYRQAIRTDARDWSAWQGLAEVTQGLTRAHAEAQVRRLNPLELSQ